MAELPEVQDYLSRVATREQRVNTLQADLDRQNQNLSEEQSRFNQSVRNTQLRRGTPSLPATQKLQQMGIRYDTNRQAFIGFQTNAQKQIQAENDAVQAAYLKAQAAQQAEEARQADLLSRYQTGNINASEYGELVGEQFSQVYGGSPNKSDIQNVAYYEYLTSKGKSLDSSQQLDLALSKKFSSIAFKEDYSVLPKKTISAPTTGSNILPEDKLIINGEAVIGGYSSITGQNVLITSSGKTLTQVPASIKPLPVSTEPFPFEQDIKGFKDALPASFVIGGLPGAGFVQFKPITPNTLPFSTTPELQLAGIKLSDDFKQQQAFLNSLGSARVPYETITNLLTASKQIREALFIIGANAFRGIADTGRNIGRGIYEFTSPKPRPGELPLVTYLRSTIPSLAYVPNKRGLPELQFIPANQRPTEYHPLQSPVEFQKAREQEAIIGGTAFALLPYAAGGMIAGIQHIADIGSAFKENPQKAATLIGVGIASTVLFNELGLIGRVIKGQLGGTIAGSVGFAKTFEDITSGGGKLLGLGLLAPYALSEAPPLISAFEAGDVKKFQQSVSSIQQSSGPLFLGSQIGQRFATGFTLFRGTLNAKIYGGLTSLGGGEAVARERLIANVFDVQPNTIVQIREPLEGSNKLSDVIGRLTNPNLNKGESKLDIIGRITNTEPKNIDVSTIKQLYESEGFTKEKFLESYGTIFGELSGAKVPVKDIDYSKIEAISDNPKAQKALEEYFNEHNKEFAIYGSLTQGPQLENVKIRSSEDVDILSKNPKEFAQGVVEKLTEAGVPKENLDIFIGTEKSYVSFSGKKFLSIQDISLDKDFFTQLEQVGGILPRNAFVETPSGINISNISFQAGRKVVGGFENFRTKDIADVLTISEGVKPFLTQNQSEGVLQNFSGTGGGILSRFFPTENPGGIPQTDAEFKLNLLGKIETGTGIILPGTKVKDILKIGTESQPIFDIAKLTGKEPGQIVNELGELPVKGFKLNPDFLSTEYGNFKPGLEEGSQSTISIATNLPQTKIEAVFAHEFTHAEDFLTNPAQYSESMINRIVPITSYYQNPFEARAAAVEGRFLELQNEPFPVTNRSILAVSKGLGEVPQTAINATPSGEFNLTLEGRLRTLFGVYSPETKVEDILTIGKYSQPIQDISTVTGLSNQKILTDIQNLPIQKLTTPGAGPSQFGDELIGGKPGIKIIGLSGSKAFTEGALAHEIEHAGEFFGGTSEDTSKLTGLAYLQSPTEVRAFTTQQSILAQSGKSLPADILLFTGAADRSNIVKAIIQPSSGIKSTNNFSQALELPLLQINAKVSGAKITPNYTDIDKIEGIPINEYYKAPAPNSYPLFFPVLNQQKTIYKTPTKSSGNYYAPLSKASSQPYFPASKYDIPYLPTKNNGIDNYPINQKYSPEVPYNIPEAIPPGYTPPGEPYIPPYVPPSEPYIPATPYTPTGVSPYKPPPPKENVPLIPLYIPPLQQKKQTELSKPKGKKKKEFTSVGYNVFVLKNIIGKKQFQEVDYKGTSLSMSNALKFGENVVDRSLEASFFIRPSKRPLAELSGGLPDVSYKFRISKQKIRKTIPVYVEKETYRLDTPAEVKKIHAASIAAQLRKNIIKPNKPTKRNNFRGF